MTNAGSPNAGPTMGDRVMMSRRGLGLLIGSAAFGSSSAAQAMVVEAWRDPDCGCCAGWVAHLRGAGFAVTDRVVPSIAPIRRVLGTPPDLLSCHAGRVAGLAIEGHVPALAIRRFLDERPTGVVGLAVPAMPIGTPGMEMPGRDAETFNVIAWSADGTHRPWLRMRGAEIL